ncbi:hypothetical protein ACPWR0_21815 [Pandoraea pneumonica]|uniref:hypothetical protein n=1 Tax=Pandoraea pneumonica TaxID=2508299 RepID=UPI003CF00B77
MRTESISMGTVPRVAVLPLRSDLGDAGEELFNIEALTAPDDMRSHTRASQRSVAERNRSAWVNACTAIAFTTFGLTSLAATVYLTLFDADLNVRPLAGTDDYFRYGAGVGMTTVSMILIGIGVKHARGYARARRGESVAPSIRPIPPVNIDMEIGARDRI